MLKMLRPHGALYVVITVDTSVTLKGMEYEKPAYELAYSHTYKVNEHSMRHCSVNVKEALAAYCHPPKQKSGAYLNIR